MSSTGPARASENEMSPSCPQRESPTPELTADGPTRLRHPQPGGQALAAPSSGGVQECHQCPGGEEKEKKMSNGSDPYTSDAAQETELSVKAQLTFGQPRCCSIQGSSHKL